MLIPGKEKFPRDIFVIYKYESILQKKIPSTSVDSPVYTYVHEIFVRRIEFCDTIFYSYSNHMVEIFVIFGCYYAQ